MSRYIVILMCSFAIVHAQPDYSMNDVIDMIQSMNRTIADLNRNIDKIIKASQPVAFTACLTPSDHLGDHQTVEYDHVVTNIGGGYDTRHSHFTAPSAGLYQFSVTVMALSITSIHVHLVKNGAELVKAYSAQADYESGSNEVNVHLQKGDMVWVQNLDINVQLSGSLWNCFSGVLVQPDL